MYSLWISFVNCHNLDPAQLFMHFLSRGPDAVLADREEVGSRYVIGRDKVLATAEICYRSGVGLW